jgi:hypothetical protein
MTHTTTIVPLNTTSGDLETLRYNPLAGGRIATETEPRAFWDLRASGSASSRELPGKSQVPDHSRSA